MKLVTFKRFGTPSRLYSTISEHFSERIRTPFRLNIQFFVVASYHIIIIQRTNERRKRKTKTPERQNNQRV